MAAQKEKRYFCHGRVCRDDDRDRRWNEYPKQSLIKVTHGYNIWNKPHNYCEKCFREEVCKAKCSICDVWIRKKDDMITFDVKNYCTYCLESLEENDPPGEDFGTMLSAMHAYIDGDRSSETILEMRKAINSASEMRNLHRVIKQDPRKSKINVILMSADFTRIGRYRLIESLSEQEIKAFSNERVKDARDLLRLLLKSY